MYFSTLIFSWKELSITFHQQASKISTVLAEILQARINTQEYTAQDSSLNFPLYFPSLSICSISDDLLFKFPLFNQLVLSLAFLSY